MATLINWDVVGINVVLQGPVEKKEESIPLAV